jgi:hypothetical protein
MEWLYWIIGIIVFFVPGMLFCELVLGVPFQGNQGTGFIASIVIWAIILFFMVMLGSMPGILSEWNEMRKARKTEKKELADREARAKQVAKTLAALAKEQNR